MRAPARFRLHYLDNVADRLHKDVLTRSGKLVEMKSNHMNTIAESLGRIVGFEALEQREIEELAKSTQRVFVNKGEVICVEGEYPSYFFGIEEGMVKLLKTSESGVVIAVNILAKYQFFNSLVLLQKMPHYWSAVALEDSFILRVWKSHYYNFVLSHPNYAMRLLQINGIHLRVAYERVQDAFAAAASQRVAGSLCMLYCRVGPTIKITNTQLAELSGSTTATTIRIIGNFRQMDLISTRRGVILVKDPLGLEKQSGRDLRSLDNFAPDFLD